jgi:hypothetical protein
MKTKEQIKQEIVNYLTKTSYHLFSYNGGIFKVLKVDDKFYIIDTGSSINKVKQIDIDRFLLSGTNAKCILKHTLFLNKEMISIKNTKDMRNYINSIYEAYVKVKS